MSKQQIAYIKARYTPGARIELTQDMVGENIRAGTRGTVTGVDDIGSIMMHWDNRPDKFRAVCANTARPPFPLYRRLHKIH